MGISPRFLGFLGRSGGGLVIWVHPLFSSVLRLWPAGLTVSLCLLLVAVEGADLISLIWEGIARKIQP